MGNEIKRNFTKCKIGYSRSNRIPEQIIQTFANLRHSTKIERYIEKVPPINNNQKWMHALTKDQLDEFFQIVKEKQYLNLLRDNI